MSDLSKIVFRKALLVFGLYFLSSTVIPPRAVAQVLKEVAIGGTVELDRDSRQPLSGVDLKPPLGTFAIGADGSISILVYIAPQQGTDGQKTTISYKAGAEAKSIVVTLRDAAPTLSDPRFYEASFRAIFVLFILAVLVESGLALLFRWRPFIDTFDSRSTNAVVAFVFSFIFVTAFNLDITTALVNVYSGTKYPSGTAGLILTAMIIAGGSAGVRHILQSFGFRAPSAATGEPPSVPPPNEAWIAVTLIRRSAVGPVSVQIGAPGTITVSGTITGSSNDRGILGYFLRNKGRFPNSGGFKVIPGEYEIRVFGKDARGVVLKPDAWGPAKISDRALVDVQFTI